MSCHRGFHTGTRGGHPLNAEYYAPNSINKNVDMFGNPIPPAPTEGPGPFSPPHCGHGGGPGRFRRGCHRGGHHHFSNGERHCHGGPVGYFVRRMQEKKAAKEQGQAQAQVQAQMPLNGRGMQTKPPMQQMPAVRSVYQNTKPPPPPRAEVVVPVVKSWENERHAHKYPTVRGSKRRESEEIGLLQDEHEDPPPRYSFVTK